MSSQKERELGPLLRSKDGLHLTIYLKNIGGLKDLRHQINHAIDLSREFLSSAVPVAEQAKFLDPLRNLSQDSGVLSGIKGNLGIFRNKDTFRVVSIPTDVEFTCIVATSFHIKPLLKWMQMDREFLLLGIEEGCAHLYSGSMYSIDRRDTVLFPEILRPDIDRNNYFSLKANAQRRAKLDQTAEWLNDWILDVTQGLKPQLYLAGPHKFTEALTKKIKYRHFKPEIIRHSFSQSQLGDVCSEIRARIRKDVQHLVELSLNEFLDAELYRKGERNLFQVAKAVWAGRVRKLIIADGVQLFGKVDKKTGGISLHETDLDHEDDDVLDDLAQHVLAKGGEVVVAQKDQIPPGRLALAILKDEPRKLNLVLPDTIQSKFLERRAL